METKETLIKISDILSVYYGKVLIKVYDFSIRDRSIEPTELGPIDAEQVSEELRNHRVIDMYPAPIGHNYDCCIVINAYKE